MRSPFTIYFVEYLKIQFIFKTPISRNDTCLKYVGLITCNSEN